MKKVFSLVILIIFSIWSALVMANVSFGNGSSQSSIPYELPVEEVPSEIEEEVKQFHLNQKIAVTFFQEEIKKNIPTDHFKRYYQQVYFEVLTPPPDLAV